MKASAVLMLLLATPSEAVRLPDLYSQTASPLEYPYTTVEVTDSEKEIQEAWQAIELRKIQAKELVQKEKDA